MTPGQEEIIFLGDSITEGCDWSNLFRDSRIRNHGIGGDTSEGILNRLSPILDSRPRQIFIMAGINNLWDGMPVETITANFRQILVQCKSKSPTTQVIIQSVLPMNRTWSSTPERIPIVNAAVVALNTSLQALVHEFHCYYVDIHSLFLNEGQLDARYTYDGLHLNASAYKVWRSAIQHLIAAES